MTSPQVAGTEGGPQGLRGRAETSPQAAASDRADNTSRPAHLRHPAITLEAIEIELRREADMRARVYPTRIATAKMTPKQAECEIAVCAAWLADVGRLRASWFTPHPLAPATHGISWNDRRRALDREIALRARVYPDRVATAKMTPDQAERQIACLTCLAAIYDDGFDWIAGNGALPSQDEQARREWNDHWQAVEARQRAQAAAGGSANKKPAKQKEMARN